MGIVFYKKGANDLVRGVLCTKVIMKSDTYNFEAMEKQGWYLDPKDIPQDPIEVPAAVEVPIAEKDPPDELEALKEEAKSKGVPRFWLYKNADALREAIKEADREAIEDAEQPEG